MQTQEEIVESIKRRQELKNKEFAPLVNAELPLKEWQYEKLNNYVKNYGEDENVQKLLNKVYTSLDGAIIYNFAYNYLKPNFDKLSEVMAQTRNGEYILRFSQDFGDANIKELLKGLLNCGDVYYLIKAFFENKKLNKVQLSSIAWTMINNGDSKEVAHALKNRIGKSGDLDDELKYVFTNQLLHISNYAVIKQFALSLPLNMDLVSAKVGECYVLDNPKIKPQDIILDFAKTVPNANMEILTNEMIKYGNACGLYALATECDGANVRDIAHQITQFFGNEIKQVALEDVDFHCAKVPDFDKKKYKSKDDYYEDLLLTLKAFKHANYCKSHKNKNEVYHASVLIR